MSSQESYVYVLLFFMLSAGQGRVSFALLVLTSCPYVGLGPVRTPDEEKGFWMFTLFVCFGFWVLFSP